MVKKFSKNKKAGFNLNQLINRIGNNKNTLGKPRRFDNIQISIVVILLLLVTVMLFVPYREYIDTGELKYGYRHLINWCVIIYAIRLSLHSFGWEVFYVERHLLGIVILELSGVYMKAFIMKSKYELIVSGILGEIAVVTLFCIIMYLDKTLYFTGNKKGLEL